MGFKIGVVSQKGGVGKSTLCRGIAAAYSKADWNVKIADLDISQSTSFAWQQRRLQAGIEPAVAVEVFGQIRNALKVADSYDLMVFDGAPHATTATVEIAKAADLVVLPTGLSLDDLLPTVVLANTLAEKHDIAPNKIAFALCRAGTSEKEMIEARAYLGQTPYHVLDGMMQEKTAFRRAQDLGLSVIEATYKKPREQADNLIQSIIDRLETLTK
jgi:chromosome partitioning protein